MNEQNEHKRFFKKIVELLNKQSNYNYCAYKEATIKRRIEKRMKALKIHSLKSYFKYIVKENVEFNLLSKDIFINVSFFFRDKEVFLYLKKKIIAKLLQNNPKKTLRIWVAGCATGEEAYTIAMVLHALQKKRKFSYKIIASDVDEDALNNARMGIYTKHDLVKIHQNTIDTYFEPFNNQLRISQFLKDQIIFTSHNLLSDPPFGKMDLILCRNVLIYINGKEQEAILNKFCFSLNENGYLVLGKSESPIFIDKNFSIENKTLKIFKKSYIKDSFLQFDKTTYKPIQTESLNYDITDDKMKNNYAIEFKDFIYKNYQPAVAFINNQLQIQHLTKETMQFIQNPEDLTGNASFKQVFSNEIVAIVKSAILTLTKKDNESVFKGYVLPNKKIIDILCKKIQFPNVKFDIFSVEFKNSSSTLKTKKISVHKINTTLKNQLEKTEVDLQKTIQKLEKTNQNLESFNEELQSANEEYLSVNEELQSINLEYQNTIDELSQANIYIDSLMQSTQIGTLFLDKDLKIKKFTQPISSLINITELDVNRPIHHFTHQFIDDEWQNLIKKFFRTGKIIDIEIKDRSNNWYLVKIRSYRLENERRKGASISFVNINSLKKAEHELKESELLFKSIFNATNDGIVLYNIKELRPVKVNKHLLRLYRLSEKDFFKTQTLKFFPEIKLWDKSSTEKSSILKKIITNYSESFKKWVQKRKDGSTFTAQISCIAMPAPFDDYCINVIKDVTQEESKNKQLEESELLFRTIFEHANDGFVLSHHTNGHAEKVNQKLLDYYGYSLDEFLKLKPEERFPKFQLDGSLSIERRKQLIKENKIKKTYRHNWILKRKDNSTFTAEINTVKLPEPFQHLYLNIVRDISDFTNQQSQLKLNEEKYKSYFNNNLFGIITVGLDGSFIKTNEAFVKLIGYSKKELAKKRPRDLTHPDDNKISQQKLKLLINKKVNSYIVEKRYLTKKGEIVFAKAYVTGIYDNDNTLTSYYATILDQTNEIVQKKILENKIRQNQLKFNSELLCKIILSPQLNVQKFNAATSKFLGIPPKNLSLLNLKKIIYPEDYLLFEKQLYGIVRKKKTQFLIDEIRFLHSAKHIVTGNLYAIGLFSESNKLEAIQLTIQDVSKKVLAVKQLKESENKYKNYVNNGLLATFSIDLAGHFLEANQTFYKIFGYSKNELSSFKITDILHLHDTLLPKGKVSLMQKKKIKSIELEKKFIKKNDEILYAKVYTSCVYNLKNELSGFNILLVDKSAEIKAKEKLESTLIQHDIIFKNNLVGELIYTSEPRIINANRKACTFLGYTLKELKSIFIPDVIPPEEFNTLKHQIYLLTSQKITYFSITQKFVKKNGDYVFGKILVTAIKNHKGYTDYYHVLIIDITAEIIANKHLIESESKFKGIFNSAPYGIVLYDTERDKAIDCNESALKFFGCKTVKKFLQSRVTQFVDVEGYSLSQVKQIFTDLKKKKNYTRTLKIKQKKAKHFFSVKISSYRLPKPFKHMLIINLFNIDKEEKAKAILAAKNKELLEIRDDLQLSRNKYKELFNNNLVGIATLNKHNQIIEMNTAYHRLCGYTKNELINKNVLTLIAKFEKQSCKEILSQISEGKIKKHSFQKTYIKKDGKLMHTNSYVRGYYNKTKEYTGALITIVDVSKIITITNQLKENETRLNAIVNSSFTFSAYLDLDGKIISQNQSSKERNQLINPNKKGTGKYIWDSFWFDNNPTSKQNLKKDFEEVIKTGKSVKRQCSAKINKNVEGYLNYCLKLIKNKEEKQSWVLLEAIDISELIESKTTLSETVKELKHYIDSNLELEKFAYVASHDLKEPIRSIISFSQLLKRKLKSYDENIEDIETYTGFIISAAKNMSILIEDILTLSQVHNKKFTVTNVNVPKLLNETIAGLEYSIKNLDATIHIKTLPENIVINKTHLKQIFQNLISNSLKFSKAKPVITINSILRKNEVEFIISDNGIGIEKDYYDKIFLTFKQLHNKQQFEGTGIGLSICKKIVENYEGKIWVTSKPNKGSHFHFTIKNIE